MAEFAKSPTGRGGDGKKSNATGKVVPYDFSNIIMTQGQIKSVFRKNETRVNTFKANQEKVANHFFGVLFRAKKGELGAARAQAAVVYQKYGD